MKNKIQKYILKNYDKETPLEMSQNIGVSRVAIYYHLKKLKLETTKKQNNVDKNLYKKIDNQKFVYFLGFLWADGYLQYYKNGLPNTLKIETVEEDSDHIISVIKNLPIKFGSSKRIRKNRKPQKCIYICDVEFVNFLVNEFQFDKKSYISHENILKKIPEDLHVYWFQGYMDGDGSIRSYFSKEGYHRKGVVEFSSSYDQEWDFLSKYIENLGCECKIKKYTGKHNYKNSRLYMLKMVTGVLGGPLQLPV